MLEPATNTEEPYTAASGGGPDTFIGGEAVGTLHQFLNLPLAQLEFQVIIQSAPTTHVLADEKVNSAESARRPSRNFDPFGPVLVSFGSQKLTILQLA